MNNTKIGLTEKNDARKGGVYFIADAVVKGEYFAAEAFSRTAAIRELKKSVSRDYSVYWSDTFKKFVTVPE
jgi:hypothetical protein